MSHKVQWPPAPPTPTTPQPVPATLPAPAPVQLVARDPSACLARFKVCEELRASPPTTTRAAAAAAVAAASSAAAPPPLPPTTSSSSSSSSSSTTATASASLKKKTTAPPSTSVSSSSSTSRLSSPDRNRGGFVSPLPLFSKSALSSSAALLSPTSSLTSKDSSAVTADVPSSSSASSSPLSASALGVGSPGRDCLSPSGVKAGGGSAVSSGRDLDPSSSSFPDFTPTFRTSSSSTPATPLHGSNAPFPDFSPTFKTSSVSRACPFPSFLPSSDDISALASSAVQRQAANGQTSSSSISSPSSSPSSGRKPSTSPSGCHDNAALSSSASAPNAAGATPSSLGSESSCLIVSPLPFCETAAGSERTLGAKPEVRTGRSQSKPGYSRMWEDPLGDRNAIPLYNRLHFSTVPRKTVTKKTWYLVHNTYASLQNNNGSGHPHQQQNQQQQSPPPPPLHHQQQQPPPPAGHLNHSNSTPNNNHPPPLHHHPLPLHHHHHQHLHPQPHHVAHNALHHLHHHPVPIPNGARMEEVGADEFRSHNHAERLMRKMETCASKWQLCDVVLVAGTKRLPCHRLVLAAASDYFAAMFTNNVREASMDEVELKDVDPEALASLVQYTYTGRIDLKEETVECLLSTACLLQLSEVVEACCGFLMKQLHPSNCIGIRQFADAQGCTDLYKVANNYVMEMFVEVMHNSEFLMLPCDEVCKLLASDDLNVPNEETIFEALVKWAKHDLTVRRKYLPKLLAHIKLPLMAPQYIADHVETNCLFREERECQQLIMEALKYHLLPERRSSFQSPRTKPRKSTVGVLYAVGGMDCTKGATSIEKYELRTNTWTQVANMSGRRLQFGVAVLEDRLYVVGGRDGLKTLNTVECYDPKKKTWTLMPPMSTHRHGLGVGVLEGPMYAVGGHDGWSYLNTVERWDPQARQWSYVAPMSTARSTVGVASLHGKLYAVGGRDGSSCLKSVECFDPHTNKWTHCTPMAKRRGGVGVATCNGFLYAVGGHEAPATNPTCSRYDSAERYDPKTDQWTNISPISSPRDAVGLCPLGDKLFAVGGYDGQQYLNDVECYDPITNDWVKVSSLCTGRAGACIVHVPNS